MGERISVGSCRIISHLFSPTRRDGCLTTGRDEYFYHTVYCTRIHLDVVPMLLAEQQPHRTLLNVIQRSDPFRSPRQTSSFDHFVILQISNEVLKFLATVHTLQPPAKFNLLQGQQLSSGSRLSPTDLGNRRPGDDRPHNRPQSRLPYLRYLRTTNI